MASAFIVRRRTASGRSTYRVRYRLGGRESKPINAGTFRTRKHAEERRDAIQSALARGEVPDLDLMAREESRQTLAEAGATYLESRVDLARGSISVYENAFARLGSLGALPVDAVTPGHLQEWINGLKAELAPSTIRKYLDAIRAALDHADREPNPARSPKLRLPRQQREEVQPPGYDDYVILISAVVPRYRLHLVTMEATGLRVEELLSLTWGDLNARNSRVRVARNRTKGGTSGRRWVHLPKDLLADIEALVPREDRDLDAAIFAGTDSAIRNAMARACKHGGIPHYHPHDLRHRYGSLRVQAGWPISEVAKVMGHGRQSVTLDVYSHVLTDEPAWLLERLSEERLRVLRGPSVVPRDGEEVLQNDERPANADLSPRVGVTGLEPVTPSLSR